jgi:serine phosphatase RsbU (regulator of sigma subunit)/uncharacterized protein HemY
MKKYILFFFLLSVLFFQQLAAQNTKADSLITLIKKGKNDTTKVRHLNELGALFVELNPDTAIVIAKEALKIITPVSSREFISLNIKPEEKGIALLTAETLQLLGESYFYKSDYALALEHFYNELQIHTELNNKKAIPRCYLNISNVYTDLSNYEKALDYATKGLKIEEQLDNKKGIASSLGSIGRLYALQGAYPSALEYLLKGLKIAESANDRRNMAAFFINIGIVYDSNDDYKNALEYYFKGLTISEELGDKRMLQNDFNHLGWAYRGLKEYSKSLEYYSKSIEIAEACNDKSAIAYCLGDMAVVYEEQKQYKKAEANYFKALKLMEEIPGEKRGISAISGNLGYFYFTTGRFTEAEKYILKSLHIAKEIGDNNYIQEGEYDLAKIYDTLGRYKEAFIHYKKAVAIKDTIFSREKQAALVKKEMNYTFEKKEAATKAMHDKAIALAEEEKQKQKIVIYSIAGSLLMAVVFAAFVFYSLRIARKQKIIIEKQKEKIVDSINYAQGIQQSILPEQTEILNYFPESFIFYKPKDIVSGDFYWFSKVKNENKFIIAAVDCTGHGVPGAFMSMMGNMLLNHIVNENGITTPSSILELLDSGINNALNNKSSRTSVDGMDIAICMIDYTKKELQYAGAHNPLYILHDNKIEIIKADTREIGGKISKTNSSDIKPYTNHCIPFTENMSIYLFSDGYIDQFGGNERKRFGRNQFQSLLLNNQQNQMNKQKEQLIAAFEKWKGSISQIDDILVIGIRI